MNRFWRIVMEAESKAGQQSNGADARWLVNARGSFGAFG